MYIFRYFNASHSRYLNNTEFAAFFVHLLSFTHAQKRCYGRDAHDEDIHDLIVQIAALGFECDQGISEHAFLERMRNFLLLDKQEMVWSVLRAMEYFFVC